MSETMSWFLLYYSIALIFLIPLGTLLTGADLEVTVASCLTGALAILLAVANIVQTNDTLWAIATLIIVFSSGGLIFPTLVLLLAFWLAPLIFLGIAIGRIIDHYKRSATPATL